MDIGMPITVGRSTRTATGRDTRRCCLKINQTKSSDYDEAGSEHTAASIDFTVRWSRKVERIRFDTSQYRILYRGCAFRVDGYDDFMERHVSRES